VWLSGIQRGEVTAAAAAKKKKKTTTKKKVKMMMMMMKKQDKEKHTHLCLCSQRDLLLACEATSHTCSHVQPLTRVTQLTQVVILHIAYEARRQTR
jgi:hypothetical protein